MRSFLIVALAVSAQAAHAQLAVGDKAPRVDVELLDGRTLKAEAAQGRVVLQMFWATWCPFCRADLPEMQKLYESYGPRGLEIVAVSLDRNREDVVEFWRRRNYTFRVAMRSPLLRESYGPIAGTPTYFLVDRKGIVRLKHVGGLPDGELEARIRELL